jgi:hypothetical protein
MHPAAGTTERLEAVARIRDDKLQRMVLDQSAGRTQFDRLLAGTNVDRWTESVGLDPLATVLAAQRMGRRIQRRYLADTRFVFFVQAWSYYRPLVF